MVYRELPERLNRKVIYESDYVCLYAAKVDTESTYFDENEVKMKRWVSRDCVLEMLKNNETKDGVSILALLFAFEFYK